MKAIRVHKAARREANDSTSWYARVSVALARRFRDEVLSAAVSAASRPLQYPAYLHETRRVLLKTFPYFLVFLDWQDEIYIVAVAHASRNPGYWKRRVR
ncbi:MAG TPA: type II toxin-antitoxin system RelE/ParE family toxin [Terracidiphilus sp.]|nr:type II toxin-antitoxin system RelE/ParE family toxin [Terracidiphilus sp.]